MEEVTLFFRHRRLDSLAGLETNHLRSQPMTYRLGEERQRFPLTQLELTRGNKRIQDAIWRIEFKSKYLCSSPLGAFQRLCAKRRRQTPEGYLKLTKYARRPAQLSFSGSSLRIEICVLSCIGLSPTHLILCHNSSLNCNRLEKDLLRNMRDQVIDDRNCELFYAVAIKRRRT